MTTEATQQNESPVIRYCRVCGKGLTGDEIREAGGTIYCSEHLPVTATYTTPPPTVPSAGYGMQPTLAFILGFLIPGVGAIYNGQYAKGLIHALIFGFLVSAMSSGGGMEPLLGILLTGFIFYMAFEARHTAIKRLRGEPVDEFSSLISARTDSAMSGGIVLIVLGVLLLLNTLDILHFAFLLKYWPVLLIALGIYMIWTRVRGEEEMPHTPPPTTAQEASHER